MLVTALLLAALATSRDSSAALRSDGVPPAERTLAARLAPWLELRSARFVGFASDGAVVVRTRFGAATQLHRVAAPLGAREQLTFGALPIGTAEVAPGSAGDGIAFAQRSGDGAGQQLQLLRAGERRPVALGEPAGIQGGAVWSHDGLRIAYHSNRRDAASDDILVADAASPAASTRLVVGSQRRAWRVLDWSPDQQRLLLLEARARGPAALAIANVASGALSDVPLNAADRSIERIVTAQFAADGRTLWVVADLDAEHTELGEVDPADGRWRGAAGDSGNGDITDIAVSRDGRFVAFTRQLPGVVSRLTVLDLGARSEILATRLPAGTISDLRFNADGRQLGMTIESPSNNADAWVWDIASDRAERWTRSESGAVDPARFVAPQLLRAPSWERNAGDARAIPLLVYRAPQSGPRPVLIELDGSAPSARAGRFDPFRQFVINELGVTVIAAQVRGSRAQGRSWSRLGMGTLAGDAVRDLGAVLVWIGAQRDLDPQRVMIVGGEHNDGVALASLAQFGDRLRGAIDLSGGERPGVGSPATRAERNPTSILNAAAANRPVLLVNGLQDAPSDRPDASLPGTPSYELLAAALRGRGRDVGILRLDGDSQNELARSDRDPVWLAIAGAIERWLR